MNGLYPSLTNKEAMDVLEYLVFGKRPYCYIGLDKDSDHISYRFEYDEDGYVIAKIPVFTIGHPNYGQKSKEQITFEEDYN